MERRNLGKRSGLEVPRVSIGAMRLPQDTDEAVALIRRAIDAGMTYIDTSRGYGDSEIKIGKALKDGYWDKVILSTKWSPWITKYDDSDDASADCVRRRMDESMRRLDVARLDFYQVWNISEPAHMELATKSGGMLEAITKARDEGLVDHIGFTSHDSPENLLSYLPAIDWCEIVLFTFNMLNTRYAPALKAYHEAGIGTVVMNPVGGGRLKEASDVLGSLAARVGAVSVPDLAVRFVLSHPFIDTMITGITCTADVDATVASEGRGPFDADAMEEICSFLSDLGHRQADFCTSCGYCMPCPAGIDIPAVMRCLIDQRFWGFREVAERNYGAIQGPKADTCTQCGGCEEKCTQKLQIIEEMEYCARVFGGA